MSNAPSMAKGKPSSVGGALKVGEQIGFTPTATTSGTGVQYQEFVLYGSVLDSNSGPLIERLKGLCDPGYVRFEEHELNFAIKLQQIHPNSFHLKTRRRLDEEEKPKPPPSEQIWHFCYLGMADPELTKKCASIVRKRVDSRVTSRDMMNFLKELGFRMTFQYVAKGFAFCKGNIKITVSEIYAMPTTGSTSNLNRLTSSLLVEVSCVLPMGLQDPYTVSKGIKDFADQLKPIIEMDKYEPSAFSM